MYEMGFCKKHWKLIQQKERERKNIRKRRGRPYLRRNPPRKLQKTPGAHPENEGETAWLWHNSAYRGRFYAERGVRGYNVHDRKNDDYSMVSTLRAAAIWIEQAIEADPEPWDGKSEILDVITNPKVFSKLDTPIVNALLEAAGEFLLGERCAYWKGQGYYGPAHFILQHGQYFKNREQDRQLGPLQLCYQNSQRLLSSQRDLLYVEGYVDIGGHYTPHGWNITPEGEVIDVTLRADSCEYFGIVFNSFFVLKRVRELGRGPLFLDFGDPSFSLPSLKEVSQASKNGWNCLQSPPL